MKKIIAGLVMVAASVLCTQAMAYDVSNCTVKVDKTSIVNTKSIVYMEVSNDTIVIFFAGTYKKVKFDSYSSAVTMFNQIHSLMSKCSSH